MSGEEFRVLKEEFRDVWEPELETLGPKSLFLRDGLISLWRKTAIPSVLISLMRSLCRWWRQRLCCAAVSGGSSASAGECVVSMKRAAFIFNSRQRSHS